MAISANALGERPELLRLGTWPNNVSTLSELLRKAAAGSEDEAGAEQVG